MPNVRLFPPAANAKPNINPITVGDGTHYSSPVGTPIDVPIGHVSRLEGNGWIPVAHGGGRGSPEPAQVGTTAQRPTGQLGSNIPLAAGTQYVDSDVGGIIVWDGATWRDYAGNAV